MERSGRLFADGCCHSCTLPPLSSGLSNRDHPAESEGQEIVQIKKTVDACAERAGHPAVNPAEQAVLPLGYRTAEEEAASRLGCFWKSEAKACGQTVET